MPMARRRARTAVAALIAVSLGLGAVGCSGNDGPKPPKVVEPSATLDWRDVGGGVDVTQLIVPRDHDEPGGATISLYIARHRATKPKERIGSLFVNPGGPGAPGSIIALQADRVFSPRLLERFDVIGWDPRGVGRSLPTVDCTDDLDPLFSIDVTPDSDADRSLIAQRVSTFAAGCAAESSEILPFVSTRQSAADIEFIRAALGEPKVSYFGFSYGSELGSVWATLYPATVRAAVLDGAVDPGASEDQQSLDQAKGFEEALATLLAACSADVKCKFHHAGKAEAAFDALTASIDTTPVPTTDGRPPVTSGVLLLAVAQALYSSNQWPQVYQALADAEQGKGQGLLALYDRYLQRASDGTYDNTLEAFFATSCIDAPRTADDPGYLTRLGDIAPRMQALFAYPDMCAEWPAPVDPAPKVTGAGAPPIVVIGTTGDPATPLVSTQAMAEALESGVLVTVEGDEHTGYGLNTCIDELVDRYLIDLTVPPASLRCGPGTT